MSEIRSGSGDYRAAGVESHVPGGRSERELSRFGHSVGILESSSVPHFIADETGFLYTNPAFKALTGYSTEELNSIDHYRSLWPSPGKIGLDGSEPSPCRLETRIMAKDGEERWIALSRATIDSLPEPAVLGTIIDLSDCKQELQTLKKSEMRYRTVLEFAPDMVIIYDLEGKIVDVSPVGAKILGVTREEAIGLNAPERFWAEEDRARFPEILKETLTSGEFFRDIEGVHADGRHWFAESNAKVAELGEEKYVIVIVRDVTERRQLEEQLRAALKEKELLLREIHHRVKNNMQIISSLLALQLRNTPSEKMRALFRESQNRILSMAMIHEKLYQAEGIHKINIRDYVTDLVHEVLGSFGKSSNPISVRIDVDDIALGMNTAIPCGLIVIESVTNALKHAFPHGRRGEITVALHDDGDRGLNLMVQDNGAGIPPGLKIDELSSLGLRLVWDLAKYQLRGQIGLLRENGTTVHVVFEESSGRSRHDGF
ncbi:MAG: PAS domain S-box protein [Syntrophobacteraceae bacterium]|jgi:PAS domain S-box-containing protein|nr:PAS domain S-box protein [Syntrophobacteraceae bacterium]